MANAVGHWQPITDLLNNTVAQNHSATIVNSDKVRIMVRDMTNEAEVKSSHVLLLWSFYPSDLTVCFFSPGCEDLFLPFCCSVKAVS